MTIPVIQKFGEDHPLSHDNLNSVILALVGAVNSLAGSPVIRMQTVAGVVNNSYVPVAGGHFTGSISAPSMLVGGTSDKQQVVHKGNTASTTEAGIVQQLEALSDMTTSISSPPTQAEVEELRDLVNSLLAAARAAGVMDGT